MSYYSFGVPAVAIWSIHILVGAYFMYLGYLLTKDNSAEESKQTLKQQMQKHSLVLFGLGMSILFYHAHLWYVSSKKSK